MTDANHCRPETLMGAWSIEPKAFAQMLEIVRGTDVLAVQKQTALMPESPPYALSPAGVAVMGIDGPMTKYRTSYASVLGGTSTMAVRQAMGQAQRDPKVQAILLKIESPGGSVNGLFDFADAIVATDRMKPVYSFIEDLGCSAAYLAAASTRHIFANPYATVGSIGVYTVLEDTSGQYEKAGIKAHVVRSGAFKGAGADGVPVTSADLAEAQRQVDQWAELFVGAVAKGRRMSTENVRKLADGRTHFAAAAKTMGLVDSIGSFEAVLGAISGPRTKERNVQDETNDDKAAATERLMAQAKAAFPNARTPELALVEFSRTKAGKRAMAEARELGA